MVQLMHSAPSWMAPTLTVSVLALLLHTPTKQHVFQQQPCGHHLAMLLMLVETLSNVVHTMHQLQQAVTPLLVLLTAHMPTLLVVVYVLTNAQLSACRKA